jgi:hypothetical protein
LDRFKFSVSRPIVKQKFESIQAVCYLLDAALFSGGGKELAR